jgi:ankyrin repeat protein
MIELLIDHGADPALPNREGRSAIMIAARHGRAAALDLFDICGTPINLTGIDALIAACARDQKAAIRSLTSAAPGLKLQVMEQGGTLLAEFSGGRESHGHSQSARLGSERQRELP